MNAGRRRAAEPPATSGGPAGAPSRGGFTALAPLRHRNYTLLWSGGLVSVVGSWMQTVAVGALVISGTGKATWAVLVAAGAFLPIGLLSPVGGALADRIPRRAALVAGNLLAGACAVALAALVASGHDAPGVLTLVVTVQGCVAALTLPFQQAILPDLVPRSEFLAAVSLNSAQFNLGRVIGPVLAGATVAAFGYPMAFVANAVSFLAVVVALVFVRLPPPPGAHEGAPGLFAALRLGLEQSRREPGCRSAIGTIAVVALLASPFIALIPAVAHHLVHGSSRAIATATAWLTTAQGVGAVTGALLVPPLARRLGRGRVLAVALFLLPLAVALYGAAPTIELAIAAMFVLGVVYIAVLSGLSTVVQLRAPTRYRGRILSFYLVALGVGYPIGALAQGPLVDRLGLAETVVGAAALLAVVLGAVRLGRPRALGVLFEPVPGEVGSPLGSEGSPADPDTAPADGSAAPADPARAGGQRRRGGGRARRRRPHARGGAPRRVGHRGQDGGRRTGAIGFGRRRTPRGRVSTGPHHRGSSTGDPGASTGRRTTRRDDERPRTGRQRGDGLHGRRRRAGPADLRRAGQQRPLRRRGGAAAGGAARTGDGRRGRPQVRAVGLHDGVDRQG